MTSQSRAYGLTPIPVGAVVIGLIGNPSSGAARLLGLSDQSRYNVMREVVEQDIVGVRLTPATDPPPMVVNARPDYVFPLPAEAARKAPAGRQKLSLRYKIWSTIAVSFLGFAFINTARDEDRTTVALFVAFWSVAAPMIMFATGLSAGAKRSAVTAAILGAVTLLVIGAAAVALAA